MTQIEIDGQPVSLSPGRDYDYIARNPIFTKEGEHTYDVDIDLSVPENARLYHHINRHDCNNVPTGRTARLMCDNRCIITGSEIVLSMDNNMAKIQLVGGNSEMNFNGKKKIRELDFGKFDVTLEKARASLSGSYPSYGYVCCPVLCNTEQNFWGVSSAYYNLVDTMANPSTPVTAPAATLRPQPYLIYYVEKLMKLMGYSIKENVMKDGKTDRLICVNGMDTNLYADLLPDWTVDEFITQIERLFNLIFVIGGNGKEVSIVRSTDYYAKREPVVIPADDVLRDIRKEFQRDEEVYLNYTNVKYEFPDIEYYQFADLEPEVIDLCEKRENPMLDLNIPPDTFNKFILYRDQKFGQYHIHRTVSNEGGTHNFKQHIMFLQRKVNDPLDNDFVELEIVPAEIYLRKDGEVYSFCVPFSRNVIEVNGPQNPENKIKEPGLVDVIQNGIQKKQAPNRLFIAYYDGYQEFFLGFNPNTGEAVRSGQQLRIPMCHTIPFEHGIYSAGDTGIYCVWPDKRVTLAIDGEYGLYNTLYKTNQKVNTSQRITISFLRHGRMFNPLDTYIIAHKKYFCEELKYKFNEQGLSDVVEGTFLLM